MSRLIRLYPEAWRQRYEVEVEELLAARPLTAGRAVDVVLGAVDAHLHPEMVGAIPRPWTHRLPGMFAAVAGLIWSWFWVRAYLASPQDEWGDFIGLAVMLMLIAVPGDYLAAHGRRIALVIVLVVAAAIAARFFPWNTSDGMLNVAFGAIAYVLVGGGWLTLVAIRAGVSPAARWVIAISTTVLPAMIAIVGFGGFGPGDPGGMTALLIAMLPYGLAWTLLGIMLVLRGSATITGDLPIQSTANPATEVPAA